MDELISRLPHAIPEHVGGKLWRAMAQARLRVKVRRRYFRRIRESDAARPNSGRRWLPAQAATNRPRKRRVVVVVEVVRSCVIAAHVATPG
ncbi:hypothetical protein [Novosphingobium sp.]|uniref:hypothetical protein n=1 Tax=Novosphingobium sp. TaxID=1874826 RepID=UPI0028AB0352|nr:hypothetical protein [Novosphingobium sp.]